ncbi:MAG: PilZ domain-containing protein [Pseudomonadota bacterium]
MMDDSDNSNSPFQKIIRKLASEAQEIEARSKADRRKNGQTSMPDHRGDENTDGEEDSGRSRRIDMDLSRERRKYPRKSCFLSVHYATDERAYQEFIHDISTAGIFIETRQPLPIGQNIALTFSLPSRHENIKLNGTIARSTPKGLGVAFVQQSVDQKNYLSSHIVDM